MKKYILAAAISIMMLMLLPACADSSKEPVNSLSPSAEGTEILPSAGVTEEAGGTELSEQRQKAAKYKEEQETAEAAIQAELENGYTFEEPLVVVNPYSLSPLSAVVGFDTEQETRIDVTVKGKDANTDISHSFEESSTRHLLPIYGLYAGYDNTVELTATTQDGQSRTTVLTIKTDALPDDISKVEVRVAAPEKMAAGLTFVDSPNFNANYRFAFDCNGEIRWYFADKSFSGALLLLQLDNGNFIIPSGESMPGLVDNVYGCYEVTPLGRLVKEYHHYGLHHDVKELSNGNLIITASKEGSESCNDYVVEIDRETGEQVNAWDLKEIIPMTSYTPAKPYRDMHHSDDRWLHNNSVWYVEEEDSIIVSGRDQDMVMKFDAKTGEIRWILSETVGEENEELRPYLLKPVEGADFEYPTGQHAAMQTPEGDLMLFDNRNQDMFTADGSIDQSKLYSRAVRYEIDEENMTVKQVWQYGKERGTETYSSYVSDVDYLTPGHYLIDFGGIFVLPDGTSGDLSEFTQEKLSTASLESVIAEIVDHEVVFEVRLHGEGINANTFKAERTDIYQSARDLLAE